MRRECRLWPLLLVPFALAILPGCGGGSGGSSATTSVAGRAALDVYVTDGFGDQYKQVLVTLYKIELTTDGTTYQTVFSDDAGRTLDLTTLSSTAELLASVNVPTGTYTKARITFGDHVTLVSNSGVSTSVAVDTSVGVDTNGQIALTVTTPARVLAGQSSSVFVDFKLAEFQLIGNSLRPQISCGDGTGMGGKQRRGHLSGTVANLQDGVSFTLQGMNGRTTTVALTSTTTIVSGQTGAAITLANGQNVTVEGTFDPTTNTVTATSVTLNDYTNFQHEAANGTVASVDATTSSFVLTVQRAEGIQPTGGTITIKTDSNTVFVKGRHQQGSFTDIATAAIVAVGGTFDTTTQTLTAKFVLIR